MFKIITRDEFNQNEELLNKFYQHLYRTYMLVVSDQERRKAVHFIALDENGNYLGGARVLEQPIPRLFDDNDASCDDLNENFTIWVCDGLQLQLTKESFSAVHILFYAGLFKQLQEFSKHEHIVKLLVHTSRFELKFL